MDLIEKIERLKKLSNDVLNCALDLIDHDLIESKELNKVLIDELLDIHKELITYKHKK